MPKPRRARAYHPPDRETPFVATSQRNIQQSRNRSRRQSASQYYLKRPMLFGRFQKSIIALTNGVQGVHNHNLARFSECNGAALEVGRGAVTWKPAPASGSQGRVNRNREPHDIDGEEAKRKSLLGNRCRKAWKAKSPCRFLGSNRWS